MTDAPVIVISGNPVGGFSYAGPFCNSEDATRYADDCLDADWWIAPLDLNPNFVHGAKNV